MVTWPWKKREPLLSPAPVVSVTFTEQARAKLLELLDSPGHGDNRPAVRIRVTNAGAAVPHFDMALVDNQNGEGGDVRLDVDGIRILVDQASLPSVSGATVDFVDDPLRPGFRVDILRPDAAPVAPSGRLNMGDAETAAVYRVIQDKVNPSIASHGGVASLLAVQDHVAYVALGGGCQGCSMASVTLKQGVEHLVRQAVPTIRQVMDSTDHAGGNNPFYEDAKGAQSPFHQPAKG